MWNVLKKYFGIHPVLKQQGYSYSIPCTDTSIPIIWSRCARKMVPCSCQVCSEEVSEKNRTCNPAEIHEIPAAWRGVPGNSQLLTDLCNTSKIQNIYHRKGAISAEQENKWHILQVIWKISWHLIKLNPAAQSLREITLMQWIWNCWISLTHRNWSEIQTTRFSAETWSKFSQSGIGQVVILAIAVSWNVNNITGYFKDLKFIIIF